MEKKVKKKRVINYQKIFCFASFIFILVCILWYGGRLIYFYTENHKTITEETTTLARTLKTENSNKDTFKKINQDYYFHGKATNNYISYSNILWRIVKINKDNSILLITDNVIGTLAYGNSETNYENSNLINWLNYNEKKPNSGTFEKLLNEKEKYLILNSTCIDNVNDIENITCKEKHNNSYLNLLSVEDYLYTGGNTGFINTEKNIYLANKNTDNEIWYITDNGKLDSTAGEDILGIKATITLSPNLDTKTGTGTKEDPYKFEENNGLIGSYVNLDNDIWRIYEEKDNIIKLILQDTLQEKHKYSNNTYYHNDTIYGSLAHYLNTTFYNSLSYKNLIVENTYANGYYGNDTNYDYNNIITKNIETKVSIPSINDIIFNDTLNEYFTNTGIAKNSSLIHIRKNDGTTSAKNVTSENSIVPCISINKETLKTGIGSSEDPYRTE